MELPDDVVQIINSYAKPMTRPDWRTLHKMPFNKYMADYNNEYRARLKYINNHPERNNPLYIPTLCRYKNIFCGYKYRIIFYGK